MKDMKLQNGKQKVSVIETFDKKVKLISRVQEIQESCPVNRFVVVGHEEGVRKIPDFTDLWLSNRYSRI